MNGFPLSENNALAKSNCGERGHVGEDGVIGKTLQRDDARIVKCVTAIGSGEGGEFRQVYSSLRLCITTAHDQFSRVLIAEHEYIFTQLHGGQFWQI